ncbi:MAG TPA: MFS transporter [Verrucomicrobiae bacterium]|jgi:MFS family permease|nr:MFS transporter [Verrucomicrobiae bacterium]
MTPREGPDPARIFYGWWVALAFVITVFLSTGIRFTVGPFLKPIATDLGLDRGSFSLVVSISLFLYGALTPAVGALVDRIGSRAVCAAGGVIIAASLALSARMTSYWEFVLYYGMLASLGLAATGHVVASATLTRWFVRRRATALSVVGAAGMAGISLLVPIVMWVILTFGWRGACLVLGATALVVILPLSLLVLRDTPEGLGLTPDGDPAPLAGAPVVGVERTHVGTALRTPAFWQLAGGLSTCGFSMSLIASHGVPMLTDHGFHAMTASTAVGLLGLTSIGGALGVGVLSDRIGRRPVLAALYLARAGGFALLFLVGDPIVLFAVAALGGVAMSGSIALTSSMTGDLFGRLSVGSIFGTIFLAHQTGSALGAWLGGALFDATGGYGAAFAIACTLLLIGGGLSLTIAATATTAGRTVPAPRPVAGGR